VTKGAQGRLNHVDVRGSYHQGRTGAAKGRKAASTRYNGVAPQEVTPFQKKNNDVNEN
jgi:hypothetical protein